MARLFIALNLQLEIEKLEKLSSINGVRIMQEHHLTLAFLGEVGSGKTSHLVNALKQIKFPAFELNTTSIGVFPSPSKPRAIWVGVEAEEPVRKLRKLLQDLLDEIHMEYPAKFKPHITFARVGRLESKAELQECLGQIDLSGQHFRIDQLHLVKSKLSHTGAKYSDVCVVDLNKEPDEDR